MRHQIKQIGQLLAQLKPGGKGQTGKEEGEKRGAKTARADPAVRAFRSTPLRRIVREIVDDLQPLLSTYQLSFYWYLLRHSVLETGNTLIRTGSTRLRRGVAKPMRGETLSPSQVRQYLQDLEQLGAIRRESETSRRGTLYRVMLPNEIEACRRLREDRKGRAEPRAILEKEVDCYNVKENRVRIYERDGYQCRYCGKQLTRFTATLDHVKPVSEGGDNSFDNLVTACLMCNSRKNNQAVGDFLAERER